MTDIVDEIAALVDAQLANYGQRSGYDFNVGQDKCPHAWCREDFHGLAITQRMRVMRMTGEMDADYRYAEDDSPVLCPGSLFEGEFEPPVAALRATERMAVDRVYDWAGSLIAAMTGIPPIGSGWNTFGDAHTQEPARSLPRSFMDMATVERLMRFVMIVPMRHGGWALTPQGRMWVADHFAAQARAHFPEGVRIDPPDLRVRVLPPTPEDRMRDVDRVEASWRPEVSDCETWDERGRHQAVSLYGAPYADWNALAPVNFADVWRRDPTTVVPETSVLRFKCIGWNPEARRWVYDTSDRRVSAPETRRPSFADIPIRFDESVPPGEVRFESPVIPRAYLDRMGERVRTLIGEGLLTDTSQLAAGRAALLDEVRDYQPPASSMPADLDPLPDEATQRAQGVPESRIEQRRRFRERLDESEETT